MSERFEDDVNAEHVPPEAVPGAHDADGTLGRTAGTGTGAIAGGLIGSAVGPLGTVVGAVAGAVLGNAAGDAAHRVGDDPRWREPHRELGRCPCISAHQRVLWSRGRMVVLSRSRCCGRESKTGWESAVIPTPFVILTFR